jgi:hypothetical protein
MGDAVTGAFRTLRVSAAPYLSVLAFGVVITGYLQYLWPNTVVLKGQPPAIPFMFGVFLVAVVLWFLLRPYHLATRLLVVFLALLTLSWLLHMGIAIYHQDLFNHTAWLFVPILLMILLKAPSPSQGWTAISTLAWTTAAILVGTRVLEMVGVLSIRFVPAGINEFDKARYWLPLSDLMGITARWPGPFGHNGDTAMMGALLVVIGLARLRKSSWVFVSVGVFTLLLTDGRSSIGATIVGIVILLMFTNHGVVTRIPKSVRIAGGMLVIAFGAVALFVGPTGLTGRQNIWPAFFELWKEHIWLGAGTGGIAVSGGVTQQYGHAHDMYLDELARYGLGGALPLYAAIIVGLIITVRAAIRGFTAPLAVLSAFLVTAITEPRNGWTHPSVTGFLVILCVATAAGWTVKDPKATPMSLNP